MLVGGVFRRVVGRLLRIVGDDRAGLQVDDGIYIAVARAERHSDFTIAAAFDHVPARHGDAQSYREDRDR